MYLQDGNMIHMDIPPLMRAAAIDWMTGVSSLEINIVIVILYFYTNKSDWVITG